MVVGSGGGEHSYRERMLLRREIGKRVLLRREIGKVVGEIERKSFDGRYDELVSVEYIEGLPFGRTIVREFDSMMGQREICLYSKKDEINSMVCGRKVF